MFNLGKTKSLIGLDIGSSSIKAVELKKTKAGLRAGEFRHRDSGPGYRRGRRDHGRAARSPKRSVTIFDDQKDQDEGCGHVGFGALGDREAGAACR